MNLPTEQEIQKAFAKAPQSAQDFIKSDELFDSFIEIQSDHNLHIDQAGNLSLAINAVVLNLVPFEQLPQLLKAALGSTDQKVLEAVTKDINEKIFKNLRDKLKSSLAISVPKPMAATGPTTQTTAVAANVTPISVTPPAVPTTTTSNLTVAQQKLEATVAPAPVRQAVATPTATPTTATTTATPSTPPLAAPIIERAPISAPPVAEAKAPPTLQKYHGVDPYREQF